VLKARQHSRTPCLTGTQGHVGREDHLLRPLKVDDGADPPLVAPWGRPRGRTAATERPPRAHSSGGGLEIDSSHLPGEATRSSEVRPRSQRPRVQAPLRWRGWGWLKGRRQAKCISCCHSHCQRLRP
jgi:hypothetical protein